LLSSSEVICQQESVDSLDFQQWTLELSAAIVVRRVHDDAEHLFEARDFVVAERPIERLWLLVPFADHRGKGVAQNANPRLWSLRDKRCGKPRSYSHAIQCLRKDCVVYTC